MASTQIVSFQVDDPSEFSYYADSTLWAPSIYGADVGYWDQMYRNGAWHYNVNNVFRCKFTVPSAIVAGRVYFGGGYAMTAGGTAATAADIQTPLQLVCHISTDSMAYINANGPGGSSLGRETVTVQYGGWGPYYGYVNATFSNPIPLYPNTTYYLWIYPNGTSANHTLHVDSSGAGPTIYSADGAYLDINGWLDGAYSGKLTDYGTCDVYINGNKAASGVDDYWQYHPNGTTYSIQNITAAAHRTYAGVHSGSLSGTIGTTAVNVELSFNTKSYTITAKSGTDFVTVSGGGSAK